MADHDECEKKIESNTNKIQIIEMKLIGMESKLEQTGQNILSLKGMFESLNQTISEIRVDIGKYVAKMERKEDMLIEKINTLNTFKSKMENTWKVIGIVGTILVILIGGGVATGYIDPKPYEHQINVEGKK